jgi:ABC-type branched-subunit amino acid transport system substrate-binding protein
MKALGGQVVYNQLFPITTNDFTPAALQISAAHADAAVAFFLGPLVSTLGKNLVKAGVDASNFPIVTGSVASAPSDLKAAAYSSLYGLAEYRDPDAGTTQTFTDLKAAARAIDFDPNKGPFITTYAGTQFVIESLRACGFPCPGSSLEKQLERLKTNLGGLAFAEVGFSPADHVAVKQVAFRRWDPDKSALVYSSPVKLG